MFRKLEAKMVLENISRLEVAKAIGIDYSSLNRKMRGETPFKLHEVVKILELINATFEEIFLSNNDEKYDKGA